MTEHNLAALRAKATKGPWRAGPLRTERRYIYGGPSGVPPDYCIASILDGNANPINEANAEFIVALVNAYDRGELVPQSVADHWMQKAHEQQERALAVPAQSVNAEMLEALQEAKFALTPDTLESCCATGPLTDDPIEDLVVCPGCRALRKIDSAITNAQAALREGNGTRTDTPFAWVIPGDDTANMNGFIDAMISEQGEFTRPLYTRPQPAPSPSPPTAAVDREAIARALWLSRGGHIRVWDGLKNIPRPELDGNIEAHDCWRDADAIIALLNGGRHEG